MRARGVVCLGVFLAVAGLASPPRAEVQDGESDAHTHPDLRAAHDRCARSMVRIELVDGANGSGWVVELGGHLYVVTNRHVVAGQTDVWVEFYGGAASLGVIAYLSDSIDLALIEVVVDGGSIPVEPLPFLPVTVARGERVVIGGNPAGLSFITTEGVVAGETEGTALAAGACGAAHGHFCLVIDAETEGGSSGGPVLDASGTVVGMIWGVVPGASFSVAIPARTLAGELMAGDRALVARRR